MSHADDRIFEIEIHAPATRVWEEITRSGPQRHYFDSVLTSPLTPGSQLVYRSKDGKITFIDGVVEEVTPPHRFVHGFRFTDLPEEATRVVWELREEAGRTRVTVLHERLGQRALHLKRASRGWPTILKSLRGVVETGKLPWGPRFLYGMMRLMAPLMPAPKGPAVRP